jgi:membrane protease YdiL (CAAX protease family)
MNTKSPPTRRRFLLLAVVFYLLCAAGALAWGAIAGRPNLLILPGGTSWARVALGAAAGLGFGLLIVAASRLLERLDWAQELNRFFATVLGHVSWSEAALLALTSAVGEELLFRGAIQPSLGIWWTTSIFALLHLPPRARLLSWTALAWLMGLAFGFGAEVTGNLAGPMVAHFVINLLNLRNVAKYADALANISGDPGVQPSSATVATEESNLASSASPPDEDPR